MEQKSYSGHKRTLGTKDIWQAAVTAYKAAKWARQYQKGIYADPKDGQRSSRSKRARTGNGSTYGPKVRIDGTTGGSYKMPTKKRRVQRKPKSLKQQIAQVKKLIPPMSTKLFRNFRTLCLDNGGFNRNVMHEVRMWNAGDLETYITQLTKVDSSTNLDYSTENTKVRMKLFYKLMCKNNVTANTRISYAFVMCKDDDNESPIACLLEELADRGYTGLPSKNTEVLATATSSVLPANVVFGNGIHHVPMFSGTNLRRNWEFLGPVRSAVLGPGDTIDLSFNREILYKPEVKDNEPFAHLAGYDFRLLVVMQGDLAHDATNVCKIGRSDCQLDAEEQRQCLIRYANPKGLNQVVYSDDLISTGITSLEHADNSASAMETDEK